MKFNKKRGQLIGTTVVVFISTLLIFIIILGFILVSGVIKDLDSVDKGVMVHDEEDTGISSVFDYRSDFIAFETYKLHYSQEGKNG